MYKAIEIADWFINRACLDDEKNYGEKFTHLKIQKLLYYAMAVSLVVERKKLFKEKIINWEHGPVVIEVYNTLCSNQNHPIDKQPLNAKFDEDTVNLLESVYKFFGQFSAWKLREMTHNEDPWLKTNKHEEITTESIFDYFKDKIKVTNEK